MNPNNMRKALTAEDLIRMYDLNNLNKDRKQINITKENLKNQNKLINNFVEATTKGLNELQDQVDGNITTWFFCSVPTLDNQPSSQWQSKEEKINHLGDLYYDQNTGYAYRFALENEIFSWVKITDSDVTKALAIANSAQDTADSKRRVFIALPTTPYDVGDIWIKDDKELWRCRATRKNGAYSSVDWILATEYTNDDYAKNVEAVLNQFKTKVETDYVTKVKLETTKDSILSSVESTTTKIEHRLQNIEELNNTIKSNNELIVHDALEANAIEYKVKGKSEQKVTTGKNLLPLINDYDITQNGVTVTTSSDGTITINGTCTANNIGFTIFEDFALSGSYSLNLIYVSGSISNVTNATRIHLDSTDWSNPIYLNLTNQNNYVIKSTDTCSYVKHFIRADNGVVFNNYKFKVQLVVGTTADYGFEPYTGGIPSPDYPSKIKSIEGIHNYFKIADSQTKNGITFTKNEDGSFDIVGTSTARTTFAIRENSDNIPNGTWTIASNIKLPTGAFSVFEEWQGNTWLKNIVSLNSNIQTNTKYSFVKSGNQVVYYVGVEANTTVDLHNVKIQLEHSDKIHEYTPFGKYILVHNNNENLFDVNDFRSATTGISKIDDDYITVTYDNTGTSTKWFSYNTNKSNILKPNTNYSIFFEVKEVSGTGSVAIISNNNDSIKGQFVNHKSYQFSNLSNNTTYKFDNISRANFDDCYTMLRSFVQFNVGQSGSITFRISVVEDTDLTVEDFEYKPYEQKEILIPLKKENLFDKDNTQVGKSINSSTGLLEGSSNYIFCGYIEVKGNTTYTRSDIGTNSNTYLDENKNYLGKTDGQIFTTPLNCKYVGFNMTKAKYDDESYKSFKIYEGTDSNDYWSLDSLDDVRDELEVVNNRIILHKKNDKITLNGSETINRLSSAYSTFRFSVKTGSDNILKIAGASDINPILSNKFKAGNRNSTYNQIESICYGSGTSEYGDFNIYCDETKNMTVAEFKTWLSNNPVEVLYQLAEPYDIDLGQVAIPLRQGYNKLTLVEDLETNTSAIYLRDNVLNEEFARQLDLDITNDNLNSTKNDVNNLNTDVYNNYQDLLGKINDLPSADLITQINQKVEEVITSTSKVTTVVEEIQVNGVPVVKTETGVTVDKRGVSVDKTGASTSSTLDEAGLEVKDKTSSNETTQFYSGLADQEFINKNPELADFLNQVLTYTNNLYVKNQIQRPNGRWEPVEHPVHGKGEGIFIRRSN